MIDTVGFTTKDFEYNSKINAISDYKFKTQYYSTLNGEKNIQPLIIKDVTGAEFKGRCLDLKGNPVRKTGIVSISCKGNDSQPSLLYQCSIPKFLTNDNFLLANQGDIERFFRESERELRELGIKTDLRSANLCRVDLTKNIETTYHFDKYLSVLRQCNCKRDRKSEINAETYTIGDNSRKVCNYDKIAEEINNTPKGKSVKLPYGITTSSHILRCESRLLNHDTILRISKKSLSQGIDLYNNYDSLHDYYKTIVKSKMLIQDKLSLPGDYFDTDQVFFDCCKKNNQINLLASDFLDTCLVQGCKDVLININVQRFTDLYGEYLDSFNDITPESKRQKKKRFRDTLNKKLWYWLEKMNYNTVSLSSLYNELYEKLLVA